MPPALKLITDPPREAAPLSDFVHAMGMLASGVVLVTCRIDGRPWGMTVTAFASVSADPPTVLVSLDSGTAGARAIAAAGGVGGGNLSPEQGDGAKDRGTRGAAQFLRSLGEP